MIIAAGRYSRTGHSALIGQWHPSPSISIAVLKNVGVLSMQLFGSGWQAALRSIGVELLQLIIKMTLLKNLSRAEPGPGASRSAVFLAGS